MPQKPKGERVKLSIRIQKELSLQFHVMCSDRRRPKNDIVEELIRRWVRAN